MLRARGNRGITIAEVARKAHVGKGTVYLYWATKEDLLVELIGRDFLAVADEHIAILTADPELARPSRMLPHLLGTAADHYFVSALDGEDDELLGVLVADPRAKRLVDTLGPRAVMHRVLPLWRRDGLARTDWALTDQAFALHALITGFVVAQQKHNPPLEIVDSGKVLGAAVTALLGPERADAEQLRNTAADGLRMLTEIRDTVLEIIKDATVSG